MCPTLPALVAGKEGDVVKELIVSLFGAYTPVTYAVESVAADGSTVVNDVVASGFAGCDWEWITGVLLFAVVLVSFFRMVGVLLKHG